MARECLSSHTGVSGHVHQIMSRSSLADPLVFARRQIADIQNTIEFLRADIVLAQQPTRKDVMFVVAIRAARYVLNRNLGTILEKSRLQGSKQAEECVAEARPLIVCRSICTETLTLRGSLAVPRLPSSAANVASAVRLGR